ncbi:MAG: KOW domain-containing RNA-binding protein [Clostridiales bacterium]|nr:KOW domain-containing RNA-binding protein [Clostridiales bacterium]
MVEYRLGYFATSLCGHDKGRIYMIVSEVGEMVGLCDGVHRCLANPKMKKKKHIQMIRSEKTAEDFPAIMQSGDADMQIRKAVKKVGKHIN